MTVDRLVLLIVGAMLGVVAAAAFGAMFAHLLIGGSYKAVEPALMVGLLAHAALALALCSWRGAFGLGYFLGPLLVAGWIKLQLTNESARELRQAEAVVAFASTAPPTFSRGHRVIDLIGLHHVYSIDNVEAWFGLSERFTVQLFPDSQPAVAYRAASGAVCLELRNTRTTLLLMAKQIYSGDVQAVCLDEVPVRTDVDAIVIWDGTSNSNLGPDVEFPAFPPHFAVRGAPCVIAERIEGRVSVLTKVVSVKDVTAPVKSFVVHPRRAPCVGHDARQQAICLAVGYMPFAQRHKPPAARVLEIARPHVNSSDARTSGLARSLVSGAEAELSRR